MTETELRRQKARAYTRKHRYGITDEEYNNLLVAQGNSCAVCKDKFSEKVRPNIDHDHNCCSGKNSCGKCLRGLLCSHCLTVSSIMETRFKYMDSMFTYLTYYLAKRGENNNG